MPGLAGQDGADWHIAAGAVRHTHRIRRSTGVPRGDYGAATASSDGSTRTFRALACPLL